MQLFFTCKKCKEISKIKISAIDREEIRDTYPKGIYIACRCCKLKNTIQPNDVKARVNKYVGIITVLSLLTSIIIGGIFLTKYMTDDLGRNIDALFAFGAMISLPHIVTNLYIQSERKAVRTFNNYYVL